MKISQAFTATRCFNWQPQHHYGPEGSDDFSEWDRNDLVTAQQFLALSVVELNWMRCTEEWLASRKIKGEADFAAENASTVYLIVQGICLGFPDPPEFTIVEMLPEEKKVQHLGHFDQWPEKWHQPK